MDCELPSEFDLIVVGTGVIESVISAASSRIGKRVLHLDTSSYYGSLWASFNLDYFQKLDHKNQLQTDPNSNESNINETDKHLQIGNDSFDLKNFQTEWHIPHEKTPEKNENNDETIPENPPKWTQESLLRESRKFNIDITPKLQFARGNFVELLISSNIARYSEYRSVSRVLTWLNGQLEIVPCSRSDVFANNKVSVIEKRMLMKLFASLDDETSENQANKSFETFLKEKKLTPSLIHYVLYAIAMSTKETNCLEGIKSTKRFMNSLGRFGKTPFLFSMYGSGEITQAFCRLSAVFGAVYALNQPISKIIFDSNNCFTGIICGKQQIRGEKLVLGAEKAPKDWVKYPCANYISRAVFITDKSVLASEKEHLTLLLYPPESGRNAVTILELGTLTGTCPKELFVVHLVSRQRISPNDDFLNCRNNLFGVEADGVKPRILWSSYFSIPDSNDLDLNENGFENVKVCPGPDLDLDYDVSVGRAKAIFEEMYPGLEFLPRAPDPDEIIFGDEDSEKDAEEVVLKAELEAGQENSQIEA